MFNLFPQFGKVGKWFATAGVYGVVLAGLIWAWNYYWYAPEKWNPTAKGYKNKRDSLFADKYQWHTDSLKLEKIIVIKDSTITYYATKFKQAKDYEQRWHSSYDSTVRVHGETIRKLNTKDQFIGYLQGVINNGTYKVKPGTDLTQIKPDDPNLITAVAVTVDREAVARQHLDSLAKSNSVYKVEAEQAKKGFNTILLGIGRQSATLKAKSKTGGWWPFNHSRRKAEGTSAKSLDSLATAAKKVFDPNAESDLEKVSNQPK